MQAALKKLGMLHNEAAQEQVTKAVDQASTMPDSLVVLNASVPGAAFVFSQTASLSALLAGATSSSDG